jgi:hypothetical protein
VRENGERGRKNKGKKRKGKRERTQRRGMGCTKWENGEWDGKYQNVLCPNVLIYFIYCSIG